MESKLGPTPNPHADSSLDEVVPASLELVAGRVYLLVVGLYVVLVVGELGFSLPGDAPAVKASSVVFTYLGALLVIREVVTAVRRWLVEIATASAFLFGAGCFFFALAPRLPEWLAAGIGLPAGILCAATVRAGFTRVRMTRPSWTVPVGVLLLTLGFVIQVNTALTN